MSDQTSGIGCAGLGADEQDKVTRVAAAIAERSASGGYAVRTCRSEGAGEHRLMYFVGADGRGVASVRAADFMDATDSLTVGLISSWVE